MSNSKVEAFIKGLIEDEALQNSLKNSKTIEESMEKVKAAGFDLEIDDYKSFLDQVNAASKGDGGDLTEDELSAVAGGVLVSLPGGRFIDVKINPY